MATTTITRPCSRCPSSYVPGPSDGGRCPGCRAALIFAIEDVEDDGWPPNLPTEEDLRERGILR